MAAAGKAGDAGFRDNPLMQEHGGPLQGLALAEAGEVHGQRFAVPADGNVLGGGVAGRAEEGAQAHAHAVQQVLRAQERAGHTQRGLEQAGGAAVSATPPMGMPKCFRCTTVWRMSGPLPHSTTRAFGQHGGGLEQHVGGPGTEHARQGPARQGHGALHSAGGDEICRACMTWLVP